MSMNRKKLYIPTSTYAMCRDDGKCWIYDCHATRANSVSGSDLNARVMVMCWQ